MTDITLHVAPDTAARVAMIAPQEAGHPFRTELVAFVRNDHRSQRYLTFNLKGKVPTLVVDGRALTENVAILTWLAARFPRANLLPEREDPMNRAEVLADLAFCASGLHPIVTRLTLLQYFCDTADGIPRVFSMAEAALRPAAEQLDAQGLAVKFSERRIQ
jgi:glutathione S-transferase